MGERPFNATATTLRIALAIVLALPVFAGAEEATPAPPAVSTVPAPISAVFTSSAPPAERWGEVQIVVFKRARRLALYRAGNFEREFTVVLGLQPEGRKRHAHDARTPEGSYRVVGKARHERWQHFVAIDYPNSRDRTLYEDEVREGRVPMEESAPFGIGGELGIHGNDRPDEQASGVDWTKGCVAMRAEDIAVVAAEVEQGTPVWIVP